MFDPLDHVKMSEIASSSTHGVIAKRSESIYDRRGGKPMIGEGETETFISGIWEFYTVIVEVLKKTLLTENYWGRGLPFTT